MKRDGISDERNCKREGKSSGAVLPVFRFEKTCQSAETKWSTFFGITMGSCRSVTIVAIHTPMIHHCGVVYTYRRQVGSRFRAQDAAKTQLSDFRNRFIRNKSNIWTAAMVTRCAGCSKPHRRSRRDAAASGNSGRVSDLNSVTKRRRWPANNLWLSIYY